MKKKMKTMHVILQIVKSSSGFNIRLKDNLNFINFWRQYLKIHHHNEQVKNNEINSNQHETSEYIFPQQFYASWVTK